MIEGSFFYLDLRSFQIDLKSKQTERIKFNTWSLLTLYSDFSTVSSVAKTLLL